MRGNRVRDEARDLEISYQSGGWLVAVAVFVFLAAFSLLLSCFSFVGGLLFSAFCVIIYVF